MTTQRIGAVIAVIAAVYLIFVAWASSWWYVPVLVELGPHAFVDRTPFGGTVFSILWGVSGVLGAIVLALGVAIYAKVGNLRLLLLAVGGALLLAWLVFWSTSSHNPVTYGVGGGVILLCFLLFCLDWAATRRGLTGAARSAADLRLAANVSFFITAWGLCGLLGAPIFLLRPELRASGPAGSSLAIKVIVCLVLGWVLTALAQRMERRANREPAAANNASA